MPEPITTPEPAQSLMGPTTETPVDPVTEPTLDQSLLQFQEAITYVEPQWFTLTWALIMLAVTLLLSWAMGQLMQLAGLQRARKWLALIRVLLWSFIVVNLAFALSSMVSEMHWLPVGIVALSMSGLAALPWLRNITAGLAIAFDSRFEIGDPVRHGQATGEITHFGARAVTLRADDGTLHQVPNQIFAQTSVTLIESEGDAACEILVVIPQGVSPERAMHLAKQAAFLTPLASPRHSPEVYLEMGDHSPESIEMRIRGWAFDPSCREAFQSDVVARIHDLLRSEKSSRNSTT
ncbi:mechanosensitive ion channel domain-containing protein [Bradymonas sediminis]|uniref:Uncharacterized protein n=1 Tax=Bradymonas sediminis TaxID=1548548 RepID=A0A2Z4FNX3_9DELT|nr:mechanosensitive ion channel family protein [Bradymonas sediminis]AWV90408.1 hypothetical protein DN745_14150 [Bradymonas sediminis]TDP72206.1 small-conductance mechanosensitive channel [Bradymonas sediminis]